jgi:hypothetical protein
MALQAHFEFCKKLFTSAKELLSMKKIHGCCASFFQVGGQEVATAS